jgi:hypothetical protein
VYPELTWGHDGDFANHNGINLRCDASRCRRESGRVSGKETRVDGTRWLGAHGEATSIRSAAV